MSNVGYDSPELRFTLRIDAISETIEKAHPFGNYPSTVVFDQGDRLVIDTAEPNGMIARLEITWMEDLQAVFNHRCETEDRAELTMWQVYVEFVLRCLNAAAGGMSHL